jgi:hypothetical protein
LAAKPADSALFGVDGCASGPMELGIADPGERHWPRGEVKARPLSWIGETDALIADDAPHRAVATCARGRHVGVCDPCAFATPACNSRQNRYCPKYQTHPGSVDRETPEVRAAHTPLPRRVHLAPRDRGARAPAPEGDLQPPAPGSGPHAARARQPRAAPRCPARCDERPSGARGGARRRRWWAETAQAHRVTRTFARVPRDSMVARKLIADASIAMASVMTRRCRCARRLLANLAATVGDCIRGSGALAEPAGVRSRAIDP